MRTDTYDEKKWKLVPVEPAPEMIAAVDRIRHGRVLSHTLIVAAIEFAPEHPSQPSVPHRELANRIDEVARGLAHGGGPGESAAKMRLLEIVSELGGTGVLAQQATAQPSAQAVPQGWRVQRNGDGTIGVFAPTPQPGESKRTSECLKPGLRGDLEELMFKFFSHALAQQEPKT